MFVPMLVLVVSQHHLRWLMGYWSRGGGGGQARRTTITAKPTNGHGRSLDIEGQKRARPLEEEVPLLSRATPKTVHQFRCMGLWPCDSGAIIYIR